MLVCVLERKFCSPTATKLLRGARESTFEVVRLLRLGRDRRKDDRIAACVNHAALSFTESLLQTEINRTLISDLLGFHIVRKSVDIIVSPIFQIHLNGISLIIIFRQILADRFPDGTVGD